MVVAPIILLFAGLFWDNYARKSLSLLGVVFFCVLGFAGGLAYFEPERFKMVVLHGSYWDDVAAYLAVVIGANLAGYLGGMLLHFLVGRSRFLRMQLRGTSDQEEHIADRGEYYRSWNSQNTRRRNN